MAYHSKTITIPFGGGNPTDIANNTNTLIANNIIYIPENNASNTVIFDSVSLYLYQEDISTVTGATQVNRRANCTLNGAATSQYLDTNALTNTGENWGGFIGPINLTAYFAANFGTVKSKSCQIDFHQQTTTGTGTGSSSVMGYMDITYRYDDSWPTHVKTIWFPLSESRTALTTTANSLFGVLPALANTNSGDSLLPETSPDIKYAWLVLKGNDNNNAGTTGNSLNVSIGQIGTANTAAAPTVNARSILASDIWRWRSHNLLAFGANTQNHMNINVWTSAGTRFHNLIGEVWVTYEFDKANTTRVINQTESFMSFASPLPGTTSANADTQWTKIIISEPGVLDLKAAAVQFHHISAAAATIQIKGGDQTSYAAYADIASIGCGQKTVQHKLAGNYSPTNGLMIAPASGNGITLTANTELSFNVSVYRSAGAAYLNGAKITLLYHSNVASTGLATHNRVLRYVNRPFSYATTGTELNWFANTAAPLESNYFINAVGLKLHSWQSTGTSAYGVYLKSNNVAPKTETGDWKSVKTIPIIQDAELAYLEDYTCICPLVIRYPQQRANNLIDANTYFRNYKFVSPVVQQQLGFSTHVTVHNITYEWRGTLSNTGPNPVTINLCRTDTGERYASNTVTGNVQYSFTVYDNSISYYAEAYSGSAYLGRSDNATANGS